MLPNLKQIEEAINFARLQAFRSDIVKFAEYVMRDENGEKWHVPDFHKEIYALLLDVAEHAMKLKKATKGKPIDRSKRRNVIVLAPRDHGKTSLVACLLLFLMGKYPTLRIKYVSSSDMHSKMVLGLIKHNVEDNDQLHEVFPDLRPDPDGRWSATEIDILRVTGTGEKDLAALGIKDPTLAALGVTSSATGSRADIIIFDDMIGSRSAVMEPGRLETIKTVFWQDWMNIGRYCNIAIGNPWTPDDIHAELSVHPQWELWKKPAIVDDKPIWPERWPLEELMNKKRESESNFALMYMLQGVKDKQVWWTPAIIEKCKHVGLQLGQTYHPCKGRVLGIDPAVSLKRTGSMACLTAVGYDEFRHKTVLEIRRGRFGARAVAEHAIEMHERWNFDQVVVENNALQEFVIELIDTIAQGRQQPVKMPLRGIFTGSNKWNPEIGLPRLVTSMDNGNYTFPFAGDHTDPLHMCPICSLMKEMLGYPYDTDTTDMIMSLWLADTAIEGSNLLGDLPSIVEARYVKTGW